MKAVLKILLIVIIVVSILFLLLLSPFIAADFLGRIQNNKIRNEIFDYVLENQAELEQSISGSYKNFVCQEMHVLQPDGETGDGSLS